MTAEPQTISLPVHFRLERGFTVRLSPQPCSAPETTEHLDPHYILLQNDRAFRLFVACSLLMAALVLMAMILH